MTRTSHGLRIAAILATAALGLTACGGTSDESSDTSTSPSEGAEAACGLKLGFMGALTGPAAGLGINIERGVELAIDQYNEEYPDCTVGLEKYDTQGDPTQAGPLARQAVNDDAVIGIVGPAFSGESAAVDPTFAEAGLPTITASATDPTLSEQGWDTFFRILGNDASQGPAAADYIKNKIGSTKVFVMDDATPYGKGLADQVRDTLGNDVVGDDEVQTGQTDFSASVTKVTSSGADTLFYGGYYPEAGPLIKQLRAANWKGTFITADGVKDPGFIEGAGKAAAQGTIITCPCIPPEQASGSFFKDYKAQFNVDPGTYGPEAFDATNVFLAGIEQGIDTRPAMLDFVTNYTGDGITKHIAWTSTGESKDIHVYAYKVNNGEIVYQSQIK
jgi:branched-chain amino acid transport system substrate-binding protein